MKSIEPTREGLPRAVYRPIVLKTQSLLAAVKFDHSGFCFGAYGQELDSERVLGN
jgi:hypothetical protein